MDDLMWGIISAAIFVVGFILFCSTIQWAAKKDNKNDMIYDCPKLDMVMINYNKDDDRREYLIRKYEALELVEKIINKISNKYSKLIFDKAADNVIYAENKDGDWEGTITKEIIYDILNELAARDELIREAWKE